MYYPAIVLNNNFPFQSNEIKLPVIEGHKIPTSFSLSQNFPNPFNNHTAIRYQLPFKSHVLIEIYSIQGRKVNTIIDEEKGAGTYSYTWDGVDQDQNVLSSGIYFYQIKVDDYIKVNKMILIK